MGSFEPTTNLIALGVVGMGAVFTPLMLGEKTIHCLYFPRKCKIEMSQDTFHKMFFFVEGL